jgi:hypothetical protein
LAWFVVKWIEEIEQIIYLVSYRSCFELVKSYAAFSDGSVLRMDFDSIWYSFDFCCLNKDGPIPLILRWLDRRIGTVLIVVSLIAHN